MKRIIILICLLAIPIVAYAISGASYDSVSLSITAQDTDPYGLDFKPDGTKMFHTGATNNKVYQYSCSTAWLLSSCSYDSKSCTVTSQTGDPHGVVFNSSGTKMLVAGNTAFYQYSLSTPWDVSTCSYDSVSLTVSGQDGSFHELFFKSDYSKLYGMGLAADIVFQYNLPTPGTLASASYDSKSFSVNTQENQASGLAFSLNGKYAYAVGVQNDTVYRYSGTTAWDASTFTYASDSFSVSAQMTDPRGLAFRDNGTRMFVLDRIGDTIYQYSTGELWPPLSTTPTYSSAMTGQWF